MKKEEKILAVRTTKTEVVGFRKTSKVEIDKTLNKFQGEVLFKSTLGKAREAFANLNLPEKTKVHS
jgi:hypothetical protein